MYLTYIILRDLVSMVLIPSLSQWNCRPIKYQADSLASLRGQVDVGTGHCKDLPHWLIRLNIALF